MKKKFIFLTIIGTYLIFILSAPIALAIKSEISFDVEVNDIVEPIQPSQSNEISFKVKYKLELGALGKIFYLNRRIGRMITFGFFQLYILKFLKQLPKANLSLSTGQPDWCQAELDNYVIEFDYNNVYEEADFKLSFTINENAPAFQKEDIIIKADYLGVGRIDAISNSTNISFMPAYVSNISVEAVNNLTITPLKQIMIPINITNNGNGQSKVNVIDFDKENWNITPDQDNIIDVGETKEIMISINPPKGFDNESITFSFEPISTVENVDNSYRQGKSVDFSITFYNDGSLEENDEDIDITSIIIISLVVIIILIIVFLLLRKKE